MYLIKIINPKYLKTIPLSRRLGLSNEDKFNPHLCHFLVDYGNEGFELGIARLLVRIPSLSQFPSTVCLR